MSQKDHCSCRFARPRDESRRSIGFISRLAEEYFLRIDHAVITSGPSFSSVCGAAESVAARGGPANAITVSLPHFARGPEQAVNVPAASSLGLPLNVSDGENLTMLNFELVFDPGLLNVTGVALVGGGTANLTLVSPGRVQVALTFASPLAGGA